MSESLRIAQVSPYPWEAAREVNTYVERLSDELAALGHSVVVMAPSTSRTLMRASRQLVRQARSEPELLLESSGCCRVLALGEVMMPKTRRRGTLTLPLDVARTIEQIMALEVFDVVHVHEPFAPSASSAALRHSRALNVATFHSPTERLLSTQVARRYVERFFGRLDARSTAFEVTRDLVRGFFPGHYEVIGPGSDLAQHHPPERRDGPLRICFVLEEERGAFRLFLRALRRLPLELRWEAVVWSPHGREEPLRLSKALRERVRFTGPEDGSSALLLIDSDVVCACSSGVYPAPQLVLRAVGGGVVPVAAALPVYGEALHDGEEGLLFPPGDAATLAAQLERLCREPELLARLGAACAARREDLSWSRAARQTAGLYDALAARRHPPDGDAALRRRLQQRDFIFCDLHMHTDHSPDCATPVDVLLETAKARGLGAIAVTDHNEVSGAHAARDQADGIKVIVAEEVKTEHQGEVIGLFIEERIPRGMSMRETIDAIRDQGGLVYVPHPFDRMHSVPDYEHLLGIVEDVDILEVFNPRVAFSAFNEEAVRFAAKYRIVAGAGSDSHVAQGLGSVKIRLRDFDGPQEFLESLRDADIIRQPQSLLYVQALKFIQTTARKSRPAPARTGKK